MMGQDRPELPLITLHGVSRRHDPQASSLVRGPVRSGRVPIQSRSLSALEVAASSLTGINPKTSKHLFPYSRALCLFRLLFFDLLLLFRVVHPLKRDPIVLCSFRVLLGSNLF